MYRTVFAGRTFTQRFWDKVEKADGCWLWKGTKTVAGYGLMRIPGSRIYTHRLSWMLHYGEIPNNMEVCHHCDNPQCVNPSHLFLGYHIDNMRDMALKERNVRGEKNGTAKLTEEKVKKIYGDYISKKRTKIELAKEYGVCKATVHYIITGRRWRHVTKTLK